MQQFLIRTLNSANVVNILSSNTQHYLDLIEKFFTTVKRNTSKIVSNQLITISYILIKWLNTSSITTLNTMISLPLTKFLLTIQLIRMFSLIIGLLSARIFLNLSMLFTCLKLWQIEFGQTARVIASWTLQIRLNMIQIGLNTWPHRTITRIRSCTILNSVMSWITIQLLINLLLIACIVNGHSVATSFTSINLATNP